MNELFKSEIKAAEEKLYKKGYYVANMTDCHNGCIKKIVV